MTDTKKSDELQDNAVRIARATIVQRSLVMYEEVMRKDEPDLSMLERAVESVAKSINFLKAMEASHG